MDRCFTISMNVSVFCQKKWFNTKKLFRLFYLRYGVLFQEARKLADGGRKKNVVLPSRMFIWFPPKIYLVVHVCVPKHFRVVRNATATCHKTSSWFSWFGFWHTPASYFNQRYRKPMSTRPRDNMGILSIKLPQLAANSPLHYSEITRVNARLFSLVPWRWQLVQRCRVTLIKWWWWWLEH